MENAPIQGAAGQPRTIEDLTASIPGKVPMTAKGIASKFYDKGRTWREAMKLTGSPQDNPIIRGFEDINYAVEGANRLNPFVNLLRKGYNFDEAARRVGETQVRYPGRFYTNTERQILTRLFPFYKFSKGMTGHIARELTQRPGGGVAQAIRAIDYARDPGTIAPDYVGETASIPIAPGPAGGDRYITGFGFMFEDPLQFVGPQVGLETLSRTTPLIKAPLEMATGETFFQRGVRGGRELEDLDPNYARLVANIRDSITGEQTGRVDPLIGGWAEHLAANAIGRPGTAARMLADPRKEWWNKLAQFTTGIRMTDVSPAAQDAIIREGLQELMRESGGKIFQKAYFPEEELAAMSPEEQAQAAQMQLLSKLLAERAKARKEARRKTR